MIVRQMYKKNVKLQNNNTNIYATPNPVMQQQP